MKKTNIFDQIYSSVGANDLERAYLNAVYGYLDALLEEKTTRFQLAGQDPADRFRGLYVKDADAINTLKLGFGNDWGVDHELPEESARIIQKLKDRALEEKTLIESQITPRLLKIKHIFSLSEFEWWTFILIAAPSFDLRYERIFGYLQNDVNQVFANLDLILDLFCEDKGEIGEHWNVLDERSVLVSANLVKLSEATKDGVSELRKAYRVEPAVVSWILSGELNGRAIHLDRSEDERTKDEILNGYDLPKNEILSSLNPWINIVGDDATRARLAAIEIASTVGAKLVDIKLNDQADAKEHINNIQDAIRDAKLLDAILYIHNAQALIGADEVLPKEITDVLKSTGDTLLISSKSAFKLDADTPDGSIVLMRVNIDVLDSFERLDIWKMMLDGVDGELDEYALTSLAGQFDLTAGQIVLAVNGALARALQVQRELRVADLVAEARVQSGHALGELATKIEPRFEWSDLVLPDSEQQMLRDMVSMAQNRPLVLEKWGLGDKLASGSGISALFAGPPGTGKTLAAQIMARELGIDLYRIDLSTVVSKFVGETEKNLERLFDEAAQSNAMLFFDEADTIFGKRSEVKDAQDRYANLEVGYLLQRMESYSGVAILATNLRANLDDAFTRRLHFIVTFPMPDEDDRYRIWKVLLPPDLPLSEDVDLRWLAKKIKLAGGNIRNILMGAAFIAASENKNVGQAHLLQSARREMEKMGKLISDKELQMKDLERNANNG